MFARNFFLDPIGQGRAAGGCLQATVSIDFTEVIKREGKRGRVPIQWASITDDWHSQEADAKEPGKRRYSHEEICTLLQETLQIVNSEPFTGSVGFDLNH